VLGRLMMDSNQICNTKNYTSLKRLQNIENILLYNSAVPKRGTAEFLRVS
jgi:hypothetical protein